MFSKHPPHIRRKIAFICTLVVAVALVVVLIINYSKPKGEKAPGYEAKFGDFYNTILEDTKSLFNGN